MSKELRQYGNYTKYEKEKEGSRAEAMELMMKDMEMCIGELTKQYPDERIIDKHLIVNPELGTAAWKCRVEIDAP